jgi:uncharacterized membrane protein
MNNQLKDLAKRVFDAGIEGLSERERRVLHSFSKRLHISRNTNRQFEEKMTFGQRLADRVASFGGSWTFILIFGGILVSWIVVNSFILIRRGLAFDPYPYILLNLVLSMLAAMQAPVIMMSQNRQAAKDRLDAAHDYEVNLKAELEILGLHEKLDALRESQWTELILMQQEQIKLLTQLLAERSRSTNNPEGETTTPL